MASIRTRLVEQVVDPDVAFRMLQWLGTLSVESTENVDTTGVSDIDGRSQVEFMRSPTSRNRCIGDRYP